MRSIARKLLVPNLLVGGLIAVALGQVIFEATVQAHAAERAIADVQTTNAHLTELSQRLAQIEPKIFAYQLRHDPGSLSDIERIDGEMNEIIAHIGQLPIPPRGAVLWRQFVLTHAIQVAARNELLAARRAVVGSETDPVFAKWRFASEQRSALLADLTTYNVRRLGHSLSALSGRRDRWLTTLGIVIASSIALAALSSALLARTVVRPLAAMTATADRIASQQVALRVEGAERRDEIGVLARAFNGMTRRLVDANAKLTEAVRARDEFLSIASHELKTPLTSAKLQLQMESRRMASRQHSDPAPGGGGSQRRSLEIALRQLDRLEALTESLLDVTRLRAGRLEMRRREMDLSALVASVVERFSPDLARSDTVVRLDLQEGVVGAWDPDRLDQVVSNLLANVVKYAPGAPVDLAVARKDGHAVLRCRDHGPGLSDDVQDRAFHPFERASNTRSVGGLGLGLFIVKGVVTAHGGSISARNVPGAGAEFVVELPLDGEAPSPTEPGWRSASGQGS